MTAIQILLHKEWKKIEADLSSEFSVMVYSKDVDYKSYKLMPIKKRIVTFRKQRTKKLNNIKMEGQILLRVIAFFLLGKYT